MVDNPRDNNPGPEPKGLLALPAELREQIYELLVVKPRKCTITMLSNHDCFASEVSASQPAISYVCHQLRHETLATFYSNNIFLAEVSDRTDLETALRWLSAIGELNVSRLRHLALCGWTRVPFGHMMVRRWVRVVLDLKEGTIEMEDSETLPDRSQLMVAIRNMKESFGAMIAAREGRRFELESLTGLMSGYHSMCEAYKAA
ncbi:hypothetical protein LTR56_018417 [Elasticomyces elasticus]|nr:hypothetical protein LTR56_018417 [Elasticomyces elasticus]KAK3655581.1 hypothetical protein LTR22_010171 [Elasticomyces elasticus]KAK4912017.1 hypothetical protein LTR49_019487 [Elasticomyces elasticus]KAK5756772.1 hypothetical protein LTS12_013105 [Elasticomyces elasticus]